MTKPPGSLGRLEELSLQLAGIFGTERPVLRGKTVIVAAGDHGVVAQGVSGYPQQVTAQMLLNFLAGGAAINVLARRSGVDLVIVDAGVATELPAHPDLRVVGAGRATADITLGPAMTREQAKVCVSAGIRLAREAAAKNADLIGTGDMRIGNTTASSAIVAALVAHSLCPRVREYLVASHLSAETGHRLLLSHMGLQPLLDLGMRLGEGSGAVLAMDLVEAAAACLAEMATFAGAGVAGRSVELQGERGQ